MKPVIKQIGNIKSGFIGIKADKGQVKQMSINRDKQYIYNKLYDSHTLYNKHIPYYQSWGTEVGYINEVRQ